MFCSKCVIYCFAVEVDLMIAGFGDLVVGIVLGCITYLKNWCLGFFGIRLGCRNRICL